MQVELDVIIDGDMRIIRRFRLAEFLYLLDVVVAVLRPLAEVGRFIGITQIAENGIRL